ncbi:MAG TPA: ribbon-helix-helix domain-containing protein, partial [Afifellaceae bacterium]|nr:ribbon-helix-helix domain-containing protein [Afifellaceae bacterium]
MTKRSVTINGHATSISLEAPFWRELKRMAGDADLSVAALIAGIDAGRKTGNLSSALRLAVLNDLKKRAGA